MKRKKAYWISYILRTNCRLKHVIEGKIEGMRKGRRRRGRRRKKLLDDLKEERRHWSLKIALCGEFASEEVRKTHFAVTSYCTN